jgi:cytochrome c oxidase subunit 2
MSRLIAQASSYAPQVDRIMVAILGLSALILLVVLALVIGFSVRYRNGSRAYRGPLPAGLSREFEIGWTSASLFLGLFLFWWASSSQLSQLIPPEHALETTSSPSSGCGRRSIRAERARSTACTLRRGCR